MQGSGDTDVERSQQARPWLPEVATVLQPVLAGVSAALAFL